MDLVNPLKIFVNEIVEARLSFDLKALYSNRLLQQTGSGLLGLFLPIFLFERLGHSTQNVLIFYILSYVFSTLFIPLGAMTLSKIGLRFSMILATVFLAIFYLCFFYSEANIYLFLALAIIASTIFRMFYWVPYHVNFAQFTVSKKRGRQIAFLSSFTILAGVITPVLAGFMIEKFNFSAVFLVSIVIILMAIPPLFFIKKVYEEYSYSYFQTFKELFKKGRNRKLLIGYGADGAQSIVGIVIWPIFIYQILNEQYIAVGVVSSAIILASIIFQLIIGDFTDKMSKKKLMRAGTILFALGWAAKAFIETGFQIFIVSSYHSFAGIVRGIPFSTLVYDEMADKGNYIDEYTVLRDISIAIGRIVILIVCLVLLNFVGLSWIFFLAAIASLFVSKMLR